MLSAHGGDHTPEHAVALRNELEQRVFYSNRLANFSPTATLTGIKYGDGKEKKTSARDARDYLLLLFRLKNFV